MRWHFRGRKAPKYNSTSPIHTSLSQSFQHVLIWQAFQSARNKRPERRKQGWCKLLTVEKHSDRFSCFALWLDCCEVLSYSQDDSSRRALEDRVPVTLSSTDANLNIKKVFFFQMKVLSELDFQSNLSTASLLSSRCNRKPCHWLFLYQPPLGPSPQPQSLPLAPNLPEPDTLLSPASLRCQMATFLDGRLQWYHGTQTTLTLWGGNREGCVIDCFVFCCIRFCFCFWLVSSLFVMTKRFGDQSQKIWRIGLYLGLFKKRRIKESVK